MRDFGGIREVTRLLSQREAADGVFTDAAEVESAVAFDDVCDLRVAVVRVVLQVLNYAALPIKRKDK